MELLKDVLKENTNGIPEFLSQNILGQSITYYQVILEENGQERFVYRIANDSIVKQITLQIIEGFIKEERDKLIDSLYIGSDYAYQEVKDIIERMIDQIPIYKELKGTRAKQRSEILLLIHSLVYFLKTKQLSIEKYKEVLEKVKAIDREISEMFELELQRYRDKMKEHSRN